MKKLLVLSIVIVAIPAFAMEQPEPEAKKARTGPHDVARDYYLNYYYTQWKEQQSQEEVTLQSNDGQLFKIPLVTAQQSTTLKNFIEDAGIENPIPLPHTNGHTLSFIVSALKALERVRVASEPVHRYIPRQLHLNFRKDPNLMKLHTNQIIDLFLAANYLDVPYLLNVFAALIVDRIPESLHQAAANLHPRIISSLSQTLETEAIACLKKAHLDILLRISKAPWAYIDKHLTFRQCGIQTEYSIADFIRDGGPAQWSSTNQQRELVVAKYKSGAQQLYETPAKIPTITSIYGLEFIPEKEKIAVIELEGNCLFALSKDFDPQIPDHPFEGFSNLTRIGLQDSHIKYISPGIFTNSHLQTLTLRLNEIITLPNNCFLGANNLHFLNLELTGIRVLTPQAFAGLAHLEILDLSYNTIPSIQNTFFADLKNLKTLNLTGCSIDIIEEQAFAYLDKLRKLNLSDNIIRRLDPPVFGFLTDLRRLNLSRNQLSGIHPLLFAGLNNLKVLGLAENHLKGIPVESIKALPRLSQLKLKNNEFSPKKSLEIRRLLPERITIE